MLFATLNEFRDHAIKVLDVYCNKYIIFKPYYFESALQLVEEMDKCKTKNELIKLLYSWYADSLKDHRIKFAEKLAVILAEALEVSLTEVKCFFNELKYSHLLPMLNCSLQIHNVWILSNVKDPIQHAYNHQFIKQSR